MFIYTGRCQDWRTFDWIGIPRIDTTVKTGNKLFAPTWEMVMGIKNGTMSEEEYTRLYYDLMRKSYAKNSDLWHNVMAMDEVALCCYCKYGDFCHRDLLKDIFIKLGVHLFQDVRYIGEA